MPPLRFRFAPLLLALTLSAMPSLLGCSRPSRPFEGASPASAQGSRRPADAPGSPTSPDASKDPSRAAPTPPIARVLSYAWVRREPSEAREVTLDGQRRKQANGVAMLYRGEQVHVLGRASEWLQVQLSDERVGWLKAETVLAAQGVHEATVLRPSMSFSRPDLLALSGSPAIEAGTLLFVLRDKDAFSEVNLGGSRTAWMLTAALVGEASEVDAAKLVHRARLLQQKHDPAAAAVITLAQTHFAQTRLMQALSAASAGSSIGSIQEPASASQPAIAPAPEGADNDAAAAQDLAPDPAAPPLQLVPRAPVPAPPMRGGAPGLQDSLPFSPQEAQPPPRAESGDPDVSEQPTDGMPHDDADPPPPDPPAP